MKLMPALPESIFDLGYLAFAIGSGIQLVQKARERHLVILMVLMALVLGCGDAFHLVPRVLSNWAGGDWAAALGVGKFVTSIAMTAFYALLECVRMERYDVRSSRVLVLMTCLAVVRIVPCVSFRRTDGYRRMRRSGGYLPKPDFRVDGYAHGLAVAWLRQRR